MVQKRKRLRFSKKTGKGSFGNRKLSLRVKKVENLVKKSMEAKQVYIQTSGPISTAENKASVQLIDGLAQGVADTGTGSAVTTGARIGNSINVQSMSFRLTLDATRVSVSTQNPNGKTTGCCRVMVVNSPNGEDLDIADVLRDDTSEIRRITSPLKTDIAANKQYKVLYDKIFTFSNSQPMKHILFKKKYKNGLKVRYDDGATNPSNFRPKLFLMNYDGSAGGNSNSYILDSKIRYFDA